MTRITSPNDTASDGVKRYTFWMKKRFLLIANILGGALAGACCAATFYTHRHGPPPDVSRVGVVFIICCALAGALFASWMYYSIYMKE
jgi:hypothetical protein